MEKVIVRREIVKNSIGFGSVLAMIISWSLNSSIIWAVIHGLLGWIYVIYYLLFLKPGIQLPIV
jgi:hypothetical protein